MNPTDTPIPPFVQDAMKELRQKVEIGGRHRTMKTFDALVLLKLVVANYSGNEAVAALGYEIMPSEQHPEIHPERIHSAACLDSTGKMWRRPRPFRHGDILKAMLTAEPEHRVPGNDTGFITTHGRFVGREEAGRIAIASGEIDELKWPPDLYSEDLW